MKTKPEYIIITPVYNEQAYLAETIEKVLVQSVLPKRWVIVDDGSTDETAAIIAGYAERYPWIRSHCRAKAADDTYYASNVYAILDGLRQAADVEADYLAILDGDISLPADYYEQILSRMAADERLGAAAGVYVDNVNGRLRTVLNDRRSTPKGLMVFRRRCYQDIGGFVPMKYGGEDTVACFTARMKGWKTWSFPDLVAVHNKPVGMGHARSLLKVRFRLGIGEYFLGSHPLFVIFKSLRRGFKEPPRLLGGAARLCGFVYAACLGRERQIDEPLRRYIRREQIQRLVKRNRIPAEWKVKDPCQNN